MMLILLYLAIKTYKCFITTSQGRSYYYSLCIKTKGVMFGVAISNWPTN